MAKEAKEKKAAKKQVRRPKKEKAVDVAKQEVEIADVEKELDNELKGLEEIHLVEMEDVCKDESVSEEDDTPIKIDTSVDVDFTADEEKPTDAKKPNRGLLQQLFGFIWNGQSVD